jgi:hypothetical protein
MSCPDEDAFARFVQGLLGPEQASDIERHVDGCARCADLATAFGRLYGDAPVSPRVVPWLAWIEAAMVVIQVAWTLAAERARDISGPLPTLVSAYLSYAAVWGRLGAAISAVAAVASWRGFRAARWLALGHAAMSLPSIVLTPLAVLILGRLRRDGARAPR